MGPLSVGLNLCLLHLLHFALEQYPVERLLSHEVVFILCEHAVRILRVKDRVPNPNQELVDQMLQQKSEWKLRICNWAHHAQNCNFSSCGASLDLHNLHEHLEGGLLLLLRLCLLDLHYWGLLLLGRNSFLLHFGCCVILHLLFRNLHLWVRYFWRGRKDFQWGRNDNRWFFLKSVFYFDQRGRCCQLLFGTIHLWWLRIGSCRRDRPLYRQNSSAFGLIFLPIIESTNELLFEL
jgi:hypothetical protein